CTRDVVTIYLWYFSLW
nr:immunoglobulin heavy chain junction region [Macaca mulatta]MOV45905.1 immunoglobulin heavy chain junction region [Macaca mulatta]MOV46372.1 immunoglobulin heavy chain junction region [Macaca mulatta]MOV46550.1 immunoglobulin heavy chain junction region [Macaca mulatta]MOV47159.1 immunoglobulin heavy chain junction region [Macaca mulatta]